MKTTTPSTNSSESVKIVTRFLEHEFTPNRKDNYLPNQFVYANAKYSRVEQKLWEFFINQINHGEIDPNHGIEVRIPIDMVKTYVLPKQIMAATKKMAEKTITLSNLSSNNIQFKHIPVFQSIEYNTDNSKLLVFRSNPLLSPYLADLGKAYSRYDFKTILTLKSSYSVLLYKLIKSHLGQNRKSFVYSIDELKKLLQIDPKKYDNLNHFKTKVLDVSQQECANLKHYPLHFEYEHEGGKQRGVTHIRFNIITALVASNKDKQDFLEAAQLNPNAVRRNLEEIINKNYNFTPKHRKMIIENESLFNQFATLHIEFDNGIHPKVKNKTAYILACLDIINKR